MAGGQFGGGAGTAISPFLIEDAADLHQVRNNLTAYYKLVSNINLGVAPYNANKGWVPIDNFAGNFNGNGKKIYNLYINRPDEDYVGVFRTFNMTSFDQMTKVRIYDLCLENVDVTGRDYVGALLGAYSIGQLRGDPSSADYAVFFRCSVQGKVNGRSVVGGFCGQYYWGATNYTYTTFVAGDCVADVTIVPLTGGSMYGQMFGNVQDYWATQNNIFILSNCIGKGKIDTSIVASPTNVGPMCFHRQGQYLYANSCRYDKTLWTISNVAVNANAVVGLTSEEMKDISKFPAVLSNAIFNDAPEWYFPTDKSPELYHQSPDYLFICGDGGHYTYKASTGWTMVNDTVPSRQQAIEKGMRHLEQIPQTAWDFFKNHNEPYIVNIIDKADTFSIFGTPFNFAKDAANSNSSKTIFRKEIVFSASGGNLSIINI